MAVFCTLFNSGYLDKGLVMIDSLKKNSPDSIIYVFAFDDKCYEVLKDLNYDNVRPISLKDFESERLLKIKASRSAKTYCWTCTPFTVKYVFDTFNENCCTYIDADMLFYSDPADSIKELIETGKKVGIVEHRFGKGSVQEKQILIAGKYCVEFNTFVNCPEGNNVLNWWADKCEDCCSDDEKLAAEGKFGDQMYLNDWTTRFDCVLVHDNHGLGMAPWNVYRYRKIPGENGSVKFRDIQEGGKYELCFYHFHGIDYYDDNSVNINVFGRYGKPEKALVYGLYKDYLNKIKIKRDFLKDKYNISFNKGNPSPKKSFAKMLHIRTFIKSCKDTLK